MKTHFDKPYSSPQQIVDILKSRGMSFDDEEKAVRYFTNISYHRLSAYIHPFYRLPKQRMALKDGTSFDMALALYRFDKKLRVLLFNEIEKIEVAIRNIIAGYGCQSTGSSFWITTHTFFADKIKFGHTISMIDKELNASKEDYIENFRSSFVEPYPPAWMITEVLSFGNLNYIYSNIADNRLRKRIARHFGLKPVVFTSWLTVLSNLRNMCCHHARIWNRDFVLNPAEPHSVEYPWLCSVLNKKRIYLRLCIIKYFLFSVSPNNDFSVKLKNLLTLFPSVDISAMGFPDGWENEPIWK